MTNHVLIAIIMAGTAVGIMIAAMVDEIKDRRR